MPRQPSVLEAEKTGPSSYQVGLQRPPARRHAVRPGMLGPSLSTFLAVGTAFQFLVYGLGPVASVWFWLHIMLWPLFLTLDIASATLQVAVWIAVLSVVFFVSTNFFQRRQRRLKQAELAKRARGRG